MLENSTEPILHYTQLPPQLLRSRRIPVKLVAPLFNRNTEYFVKCIKAKTNEAYRQNQAISKRTLAQLPLVGWFKEGNEWVIKEADLIAQMN